MLFDHVEVVLQLVDRCVDMDRGNARADLIERLQDLFQHRQAQPQIGKFLSRHMNHGAFLSSATRSSIEVITRISSISD